MSRSCIRKLAPGFTLVEVLVVVATLGMILWMVGQLLFPMRQAAERQRLEVEARQSARAACDYLTFAIRGATDMNRAATPMRNPALLLTFVWQGDGTGNGANPTCDGTAGTAGCVQTSWNNVPDNTGNPTLAAPGSDVITVGRAVSVVAMPSLTYGGGSDNHADTAQTTYWRFDQGCMDDNKNVQAFWSLTGRPDPPSGGDQSLPLMMVDSIGNWAFYRITDYKDSLNNTSCSSPSATSCYDSTIAAPAPCLAVVAHPGSTAYNAPGGLRTLTPTMYLYPGVHFAAFRVCRGWLEQKDGLFDPAADTNCPALPDDADFPAYEAKTSWSPLLPNIEDVQFAYIFADGTVWNSPAGTLSGATGAPGGVPVAVGSANPPLYDVLHVIGVRVTVTARSTTRVTVGGGKIERRRPVAEDHDPGAVLVDTFFRSQITEVAMLRNRASGY